MTVAYLSLGSNLGDRLEHLARAVRRLDTGGFRLLRTSSVYETAPQGKTDQPAFLNMVVEMETDQPPRALLGHIQAVEGAGGRLRVERWGPRTIDVDILCYGDLRLNEPGLNLPHPRMGERAFVLAPLLELRPDPAWQKALGALAEQEIGLFLDAASFRNRVQGVQ